jgi:ABC-type transport system substrate-binding protein
MLRSGEIDVTEIPFKFKREAEAAQLKLLRVEASAIYHVQLGGQFLPTQATFDPQVPWVGQPGDAASEARARMVRRALSMAVDRKAIIQAVFEGEAIECAIPFFVPQSRFIPKDIMPPAYDPAGAKKLLAEAGYANGFSRDIEMILMPWPGRAEMVDVSEAVAGFWEKNLGLRVKRVPMEYAAFVPNVAYPRKLPWVCWSHGFIPAPVAEPVMAMDSWLTSRTRFGSVAERPDIDALSDAIHSAPTPEARLVKYHELAKLFYDEALAVPIAAAPTLYAYNPKKLRGWSLPAGDSYLNGYERALPEV